MAWQHGCADCGLIHDKERKKTILHFGENVTNATGCFMHYERVFKGARSGKDRAKSGAQYVEEYLSND
jgi:Zn-finger protein